MKSPLAVGAWVKSLYVGGAPQQTLLNFPFTADEVVALGRIYQTTSVRDAKIVARRSSWWMPVPGETLLYPDVRW